MDNELRFKTTIVFNWNLEAPERTLINQGGTGSSKTYSIIQNLIYHAIKDGDHCTVVSISTNHLKRGPIRDFMHIMTDLGIWDDNSYNRSELVYAFWTGGIIEFMSLDDPKKARGPRRDRLFINEANLFKFEHFKQLRLRTKFQTYIDYNPADEYHWIYDELIGAPDTRFIQSTYLDNPYLSEGEVAEIESYREADPNFWAIYGLGRRAKSDRKVYTHWTQVPEIPGITSEDGVSVESVDDYCYGLDFGYNNPTALVRIAWRENKVYIIEEIYKRHLTTPDLISLLYDLEVPRSKRIWADSAEPKTIKDIRRAGFSIRGAKKEFKDGVRAVKSKELFIVGESPNLLKEIKNYSWKVNEDGEILDEAVKANDHALDAMRYGILNQLGGTIRRKMRIHSPSEGAPRLVSGLY